MAIVSDTASATESRFGYHDRSPDPAMDLLTAKSTSGENPAHSQAPAIPDGGGVGGAGLSSQGFELREDPSFWKDHNFQVIIRIRPLSSSEISLRGSSKCVRQESCQTITWTGNPKSPFTFYLVADENVTQEKLFKVAGVPMVENCMGGYNSCMLAYGQTGSGKTHTMLGDIEGGTRRHSVNCGMTPQVFEYLFSRIQKEKEARKEAKLQLTCKCSFLEIYKEQILDLLDPSSGNLQISTDGKKGVHIENLKEIEVTSAQEVILQLIQGAANRKVATTNMNRASSRSHSVFTCAIESKWESQGVTHHRFARLNLVDLAGSDRQKSSGAEGERLREASYINRSLSTLGLVIMNLVSISNGKSLHVPYRDSKLTFLLQDSLGGNSKTILIANISQSNCCSLETLSTLKFAQRAKFIKNNAIINEDASKDVLQLKEQIRRLKSFCEGGEREMMNEQIRVLLNKLLEALDCKLMHESDTSAVQVIRPDSEAATDILGDETLLLSIKEGGSPWLASVNDETEFLLMQPIQNQEELEALHKKLNFCLEEKEKLEKHVNDLSRELERREASRTSNTRITDAVVQAYLNIFNSGSKEELMRLYGVGEKTATVIIELREESLEPFTSLEDLEKIPILTKMMKRLLGLM